MKRNILSIIDSIDRNAKRSHFIEATASALEDASDDFLDYFWELSKSPKLLKHSEKISALTDHLKKFDGSVLDFIDAAASVSFPNLFPLICILELAGDPNDVKLQDAMDDKLDAFEDILYQICTLSLEALDDEETTHAGLGGKKPSTSTMPAIPSLPPTPSPPSTSTPPSTNTEQPELQNIPLAQIRYKRTTSRSLPGTVQRSEMEVTVTPPIPEIVQPTKDTGAKCVAT